MNRSDITDYYIIIRMWSPYDGDDDIYYPRNEFLKEGGLKWSLVQEWTEAAVFKSADIAKRIVRNIPEFRNRLDQGWAFQVVKVSEEILDHNIYAEEAA